MSDTTRGPFLTRPVKYNIEDSNIALLGSDLEKQTYKKDQDTEELFYDLHFWLGSETSQDEAGTAAYKTVELDDHLGGKPVQYREIQGYESPRFLSYFPRFISLHGGVASGFHHVSAPPPNDTRRLYRISATQIPGKSTAQLQVREVPNEDSSVTQGNVYVLDMGDQIWQFNTRESPGKVRFKAADFVRSLADERGGQSKTTVYDEHGEGAGIFLTSLGLTSVPDAPEASVSSETALFRLSDASGEVTFENVQPPTFSSLSSSDAFVLDDSASAASQAVYVWVGKDASLTERRLALQYGQWYLYKHREGAGRAAYATHIVKMYEGQETDAFLSAIGA